jgi:hypothetical protein
MDPPAGLMFALAVSRPVRSKEQSDIRLSVTWQPKREQVKNLLPFLFNNFTTGDSSNVFVSVIGAHWGQTTPPREECPLSSLFYGTFKSSSWHHLRFAN